MFKVSELGSEFDIITFVLSEFEDFGLELGDNEVFLVRVDRVGVVGLGIRRERREYSLVDGHDL